MFAKLVQATWGDDTGAATNTDDKASQVDDLLSYVQNNSLRCLACYAGCRCQQGQV